MKVWTVGAWVACLMIWGCGDKDSGDTGASTAAEADADTDTDTDTDADADAEYGGTLILEDGTEVAMQDSIAYDDVENDLALAIMHTSWAGATCNVDQVLLSN